MHPVESIQLPLTPLELVARWPRNVPLAALLSCESSSASQGRSRWSILARPHYSRAFRAGEDPLGVEWIGRSARRDPSPSLPGWAPGLLTTTGPAGGSEVPFTGGWIGYLSYDFGRLLEPAATFGRALVGTDVSADPQAAKCSEIEQAMPMAMWAWCPDAYVHDNLLERWWRIGDATLLPGVIDVCGPRERACDVIPPYAAGELKSGMGRDAYKQAVARCIEYIHAGDVFQANVAHSLEGRFEGDPRRFFVDLMSATRPWYGAYLETGQGVIASASPEMFLRYDTESRRIVTRPMKGTRDASHAASSTELAASSKDEVELTMIVDLMRNDLGRVCDYGSVRVEEARAIEHHGEQDHAAAQNRPANAADTSILPPLNPACFGAA
ncbi:MAG: chorismate-binding protein, partial [Pyrinomonadaceae bacterium]|nr:chorismate-binding protein [Phycisphaerales bacterium]